VYSCSLSTGFPSPCFGSGTHLATSFQVVPVPKMLLVAHLCCAHLCTTFESMLVPSEGLIAHFSYAHLGTSLCGVFIASALLVAHLCFTHPHTSFGTTLVTSKPDSIVIPYHVMARMAAATHRLQVLKAVIFRVFVSVVDLSRGHSTNGTASAISFQCALIHNLYS